MTSEVLHENLPDRRRRDDRNTAKNRTSILVGIGLSVLIHASALWLLAHRTPPLQTASSGQEMRITVSLAPPPTLPSPPSKSVNVPESAPRMPDSLSPRPPAPKKRIAKKPVTPPVASIPRDRPKILPQAIPEPVQPAPSLPDAANDMFTQLEAARKRRAEAAARSAEPQPDVAPSKSAQSDNSVALANIARSLKQARGADKIDAGGLFEIRHVGYQDAEVVFWGWSPGSRRDSMRILTVEKGKNADIETAVVHKIIDVIREEKTGDFIWNSHRLAKQFTLSARVQDTAELQQFLMQEFFPDYQPVAPRG